MNNDIDNSKEFICLKCGHAVKEFLYGQRNHCNTCLYSLHIDIFPHDNANTCRGLMAPYATKTNEDGELLIVHKCNECGKTSSAKVAIDDNYGVIIDTMNQDDEEY